jgi:MFS family permease
VHFAKSLSAFLFTVATAGGLLAAAIVNMHGVGGKAGWAWIFILEGLFTVLCAIASYFIIADFPEHAKFLSETESTCVCPECSYISTQPICLAGVFVVRRLQDDMQFSAGGEKFQAKYIWQSLRDWKTWVASMILVSNLRASS